MKRVFFALIIIISVSSAANAQVFTFGIKAGANINKLTGEAFSNEFSFGYHAGIFGTIGMGKYWAVQPEVLFSQVNIDTASNTNALYNFDPNKLSQIQMSYLSIPVLLEYKLSKSIAIQAGPQYSILLNRDESLVQNGKDAFKFGDFSVLGGIEVKVSSLRIYGRYAVGLSNINNLDNQDQWKSQSIQLGLGLSLF
ncbi:MAG TPA: porin family protein [Ferruginibacter sp.]|nr:porin family protein [Ferruginibacter sp.]